MTRLISILFVEELLGASCARVAIVPAAGAALKSRAKGFSSAIEDSVHVEARSVRAVKWWSSAKKDEVVSGQGEVVVACRDGSHAHANGTTSAQVAYQASLEISPRKSAV